MVSALRKYVRAQAPGAVIAPLNPGFNVSKTRFSIMGVYRVGTGERLGPRNLMSTQTLIIIIVLVLLLGGGGFFFRGRR